MLTWWISAALDYLEATIHPQKGLCLCKFPREEVLKEGGSMYSSTVVECLLSRTVKNMTFPVEFILGLA